MNNFKIAVSPHYRGRGWTDRATGIEFEPQNSSQLKTLTISKDMYEDLTGIKNSLRLNHLLLMSGDLSEVKEGKPSKLNPEELTGEELDKLLAENGGDTSALQKKVKELEATNAQLQAKINKLQSNTKEKDANSVKPIDREAMKNNNTKNKLIEMAKKEGITVESDDTKEDIVNKIADKKEK